MMSNVRIKMFKNYLLYNTIDSLFKNSIDSNKNK